MAENEAGPDDVAADVAAAIEKLDKPPEPVAEIVASEPIGEVKETAAEAKARDEKGRFAKIGDKAPEPPKEAEAPKVEVKAAPPVAPPPNPEPVKPRFKAPSSLRPTSREAWDKVPVEVQEDIDRIDREVRKVMQESAQARQGYERFKEAVTPYEPLFRAEGVDTMQGINNLMRATAVLATGAPQAKADLIANLIQRYGVDIATLDARLSGQAAPQQQQVYDPGMVAREAQEAVRRELAQYQQQAAQKTAAQQLEAFQATDPEFFEDLKEDMSKLLESGFAKDYSDAYAKAQVLNPSVARVLEQRKAAANQGSTQRAVAAASSIRAQPTAAVPIITGGSLEDDVRASIERLSRSR